MFKIVRNKNGINRVSKIDGPKKKEKWDYTISRYHKEKQEAAVFKGANRYYYKYIKNLRRPGPSTIRLKPGMGKNGDYSVFRNGVKFIGNGADIHINADIQKTKKLYATTIHELAHHSHYQLSPNEFSCCLNKADKDEWYTLVESWAYGASEYIYELDYPPNQSIEGDGNTAAIIIDIIDNDDGIGVNGGFNKKEGDSVSGYTIRQIELALKGHRKYSGWMHSIWEKYPENKTRKHINALYEKYKEENKKIK